MRVILPGLWALSIMGCLAASAPAAKAPAVPSLRPGVLVLRHTPGDGAPVSGRAWLSNPLPESIEIGALRTGCGCLRAMAEVRQVVAGASSPIVVSLSGRGIRRGRPLHVYVEWRGQSGARGVLRLVVRGEDGTDPQRAGDVRSHAHDEGNTGKGRNE